MEITRLRVLRDVYYLAIQKKKNKRFIYDSDYNYDSLLRDSYNPDEWSKPSAFQRKGPHEPGRSTFRPIQLGDYADDDEDEFFPMGDNSPSSKDARMWGGDEPFVRRKFLTGKAVLIYWPHSWRRPIPLWPNFKRMNFIR